MAKFLNLFMGTIRRRIIFGFAIIIALVIVTAIGGYLQLRQVRQNAERIVPESLQIESLQTLALAVTSLDANLERFFVIGGAQFRDAILDDLNQLREVIPSLKTNLGEDVSPAVENEIVALETAVVDLETEVTALVSVDTTTATSREINQRILAIYSRIDTIKELQEDFSAQTLEQVKELTISQARIVNNLSIQFAILALAATLVAIGATWFITSSIATPLAHLTETASRIAEGEMGLQIAAAGPSEVVSLAQAFNRMTEQVGGLLQTVQARSAELEERTKELEERTKELEASQRVTFAASEHATPDELLDLVVNLIRDQFDLYHAQVYMVDEEQQAAVLRQSTGYAGRQLLQRKHHIALDATSLVTRAIHTGEAVLVDDVKADPNFLANPLLPDTRSELVVPLKREGKVIGVLDAQDRTPSRFNPSTTALFQTMADQVAILFENSELLQRVTDQTEVMGLFTNQLRTAADIARRLGAILDPEQLLQEVVELIQSRFGLYHAHIYLLDEEASVLKLATGSGEVGRVLRERGHSIPLDAEKSLVARAARARGPILVVDTTLESDFMPNPLLPQTRSELSLPLVVGNSVLGVLDLQDDQAGRFTEAERDTFGTLAGLVATAIQNARLFERQRESERVIQQSEAQQRLILESTPTPTLVTTLDGRILYANPQVGELFGMALDDFIQRGVAALYYNPVDRQEFLKVMEQEGRARNFEIRFKKADGSSIWTLLNTEPITYAGEPAMLNGIYDITERRQAEEQIRIFQSLAENAADGITMVDFEGKITYANRTAYEMLGFDFAQQEMLGMPMASLADEREQGRQAEAIGRIMTEGSAWTGEGQGQRKDGSQFDVAVTMFPVLDANNQPLSIAAILRDITERKAAEEAVRESRERFQGLVENLSDWIWEVDPNGAYTYVSPKVTDLLGYRPEEMLGKTPFDFMPVDEVQRIAPIFGAVIAAQQPIEALQNTNIHKDGHLVVFETSGTPFYNTQGTFLGYRGTDRDITERKQAEESLRQANLVIESSPVILFRWRADEHWTVELVSDNIQQFGYTPEELLSGATPYATLVYPDDLERVANEVAAFSASGVSSFPQEYRIVTKDGQVRWTDDRTTIIRDADGNITHYEGIVIDSTARKEAETERARLTAVLEFTNVFLEKQSAALIELTRSEAVLEGNIDVALQEITSTAAHTLGVKRSSVWLYDTSRTAIECFDLYEQNTGHSHGIKLSAKDYPGYFEALAQEHVIAANDAHSHPQTQEFSAGYLTPLGINSMLDAPIWLTGRMIGVVCNEHVGPAREWTLEEQAFAISIADFVASAMEAQQRKQAEATILQERNFSTTVINSLPGAFYLFNMKGDMIRWNSNYETVTGYTAEELSTRNALDPIHEEDRPKVAAAITGVFTEGYGDVEARMLRRNGEAIPYYFTGSRLKIGDELYVAGVGIDITERVRAEAAMRESRRMLESVMNSLPESIFWKDKDLVYLGCNTNFAQDAGLDSPEQVIGKTDHDMPWKDQVVLYQADDRHVIETGESKVNYEEPQSTPDGTTIWLRTSKLPLYNEQGEAYAVLGAYADITEQKQAQEQIRIFQSLAENAADGITMVDFEGKITYANRTAYEMLGFDFAQQEMLGMPLASLADEREQGRQAEAIGRIMTEGSAWTGEGQGQRKDGSPFDIAVTMFPVLNANNQPISIAAILRDITERKQAEAEIQKRASELQTVAEVGTAASTILDPDRLLSQVVELTKTNFGLYHAHIYLINETGESLELAAGAGEAGAQMLAQGWKIAADSATSLVARAFRSREGVIANDVRAAPDFLPNPLLPDTRAELAVPLIVGEQVLGVLDVQSDQVDRFTKEDVAIQTTLAGQIATAIENARLFQESRQVDRLKSEFLANMSHELRTPLNSIIGYIQLLLMDLEGEVSEESFEDMQSIDTNSKHLLNLINDILDLAKIEAGRVELHLEEMDVAALLDTVKSNNAGLFIDSPLSFEVSAEEGLPHINADSVRITQILNNLISNAFKFTEAGGVTVRAYREDNDVCIAIQDTGIGIAEKDLDTVFERFRQVDGSFSRRAEGTGLGLSITRLLVDMHKGKLTVRSKFGEGSTFTVHLPASA